MIRNYFITAWRNISRNKLFTLINVFGLSLGICACLIIYLITSFELSFDNFHPDKERVYRIVTSIVSPEGKKDGVGGLISALPDVARNELSGFEKVTLFYNIASKASIPNGKNESKKFDASEEISPIIVAQPQYFDLFKYTWLIGNAKTALNDPFKVVLSENEAHKYFGDIPLQAMIGREVIYADSLHANVSGIVKDLAKNSDFGFTDFISFASVPNSYLKGLIDLKGWGMWDSNSQGYVKLVKGVTAAQVEKQFPHFIKAHVNMPPEMKVSISLQPLADVHFNSTFWDTYTRKANLPTLYGLMGIAAFILIIAAINFINLSTAQSLRRAKEVGVRKTLGSSKANLTIQFLIETFMVTIAAVAVSLLITNPIIKSYHSIIPEGVMLDLYTPATILFLVLITALTALLAGFYPARILSSYLPVLSLKGQGSQRLNRKSYLRKTLIIFQFTVSLIFIVCAAVVTNQIHFVLNKDLGFNKDAVVTVHTKGWGNSSNKVELFMNKIRQISGVKQISRHRITPVAFGHPSTFINYKGPGGAKIDASFETCDQNYISLFGLKIIAGRNLLPSDTLKEFLVNETCAKALGFKRPEDAIGKIVEVGINNARQPIVGVVKDFHSESLHAAITPFFFCSMLRSERTISVKLATTGKQADDFKKIISQIENASKEIYPTEKFTYRFLDETIARLYEKEQKTSELINTAMAIAIFISCMGLFGLATFTAQQRIKEIGIRKVLGASATKIVTMLSKDFLGLVVIAIFIASPIAYYLMHKWLQDFAYRVNINWWVFLLSGSAAIIIALITISFQSVKAALANPVESLRSE